MSVNKAMIIGNLGADPEPIKGGDGCRLSVATNERWTDKNGQKQERVEWHRVTCWGRTAENCIKFLSKGRQVFVEGRIETSEYTDRDGNKRKSTQIVARNVQFLSGGAPAANGQAPKTGPANSNHFDDDDIPF